VSRILVVDDSATNRELLRTMLEHSGHTVTEAVNGELALEAMRESTPDALIVDIQMPLLDGYGLLERMKADPALNRIPAVALTAYAMDGDRERGLQAGFAEYLTKPLTLRALRATLARILPQEG
jgi:CheY-like chemotaxis protein